jgi:serine/threonine protein kinase
MKLTHVRNIGQGGFGIVDEVEDEKGQKYARKTFQVNQPMPLPPDLEENVRKRFVREAEIQSGITHDNIVPVVFKKLEKLPPFFLMPVASDSLASDIQTDRTLNGKFMNALMDIIAGLEELHSMRFFHRDLKPANVLRFKGKKDTKGDRKDYYAIGDFGLMSVQQTKVSSLTQTGMRMISDYYTAPEIVKELKNASAQSDIYSVGCILHDFVGTEERMPCGEINEKGDFAGILLSCTRRDPKRRFKSVTALRDALLSLGDVNVKPRTAKGAEIFNALTTVEVVLSEQDWINLVDFVEDDFDSDDAIAVLRKMTIQRIDEVIANFPGIAGRLGMMYAKWIRERSFDFDECDGLSIRLDRFVDGCAIEVQAECLMSMLYLGTGHNRFYVERKFAGNVGANLDTNLAKRLAVEFRADEVDACKAIRHLTFSINFNLNNLHPLLYETVKSICK